jgi:Selenoprotein, putative
VKAPGNREIGKSGDRKAVALEMMNRVMQTIRATFREIFDESAYERFLLRTHASRSVVSYRAFTRERDATMLKRPRCC